MGNPHAFEYTSGDIMNDVRQFIMFKSIWKNNGVNTNTIKDGIKISKGSN